jgi:Flp pilus assembly protein TadD
MDICPASTAVHHTSISGYNEVSRTELQSMLVWLAFWLFAASLLAAPTDTTPGDRLYAAGQFEQAASVYGQLLRQSPRDPKLLVRLGATEYQLGSFERAEKLFRTAVAVEPNLAAAQIGLGTSLLALDRSREAVPFLERAARLTPSDQMALRALGHAYQKENDFLKGERVLKALVLRNPKDAESWHYLGELLYDNNYYEPALLAFDNVLDLAPSDARARIYKAGALAQLGRTEEARNLYRVLANEQATAASAELWLGYAQFLYEDQQPKPSLDAVNRALALSPESGKLLFWRARIYMSLKRTTEAEADARKAVELAPELPNAHNLLMKICRLRGLDADAEEQARWLAAHVSGKKENAR